jgi:hypothetical protein
MSFLPGCEYFLTGIYSRLGKHLSALLLQMMSLMGKWRIAAK